MHENDEKKTKYALSLKSRNNFVKIVNNYVNSEYNDGYQK